jgi:hypothetical protein
MKKGFLRVSVRVIVLIFGSVYSYYTFSSLD